MVLDVSIPRLHRLFKNADGLCYWCDEPVILGLRQPLPDNAATIDHLRDRFNPTRWQPMQPGEGPDDRTVLACHRCNHTRSIKSVEFADPLIRKAVEKVGRKRFAALCIRLYNRKKPPNIFAEVRLWAMQVLYGKPSQVPRETQQDAPACHTPLMD